MIITGKTTYFLEPNTDTDIVIPARFLKRTSLDGFNQFAFFEKRYLSESECRPTIEDKDFVFQKKVENPNCSLNQPHGKIGELGDNAFLVTWFNFGCGSSREHAVYALNDFKVIVGSAPSGKTPFADIFRDNCRQNLIRTPVITENEHKVLVEYIESKIKNQPVELSLDTDAQKLYTSDGVIEFNYELPTHHEEYIKNGHDPFEMARNGVLKDLAEIEKWNDQNQEVLSHYPQS